MSSVPLALDFVATAAAVIFLALLAVRVVLIPDSLDWFDRLVIMVALAAFAGAVIL